MVVASGPCNMGIGIADIRLIVHMDEPRNMLDYGQGNGEAGRDRSASRAIIVRGGLGSGDKRVKHFIDRARQQYRRIAIDGYLDGDSTREDCRVDGSFKETDRAGFAATNALGVGIDTDQ
jgi:superfamily II DNA helicase RecQ